MNRNAQRFNYLKLQIAGLPSLNFYHFLSRTARFFVLFLFLFFRSAFYELRNGPEHARFTPSSGNCCASSDFVSKLSLISPGFIHLHRGVRRAYKWRDFIRGVYIFVTGFRRAYKWRDFIRGVYIFVTGFRRAYKWRDFIRGVYISVTGFRRAYKWRDFYPRGL